VALGLLSQEAWRRYGAPASKAEGS